MKHYEVIYYKGIDNNGNYDGDPIAQTFKTKKQAIAFYEKNKTDKTKVGWWVTERDEDDEILDDIIY